MGKERDSVAVRVRFAPSPTGLTHLGSARTALYNYLLAKQTGGEFILRFEDTDQKRYDPDAEKDLMDSLRWLGLEWDEGPDIGGPKGPYQQTERKEIYQKYAKKLIEDDHAFYCFCTRAELAKVREEQQKQKKQPRYAGPCRNYSKEEAEGRIKNGEDFVIRFKMPKTGTIVVNDRLRGEITFENKNLDDSIIVKSDGLALYHLAAMVDDHEMDITHVFRGEEWIPSFPLHVHIYRAFGWEEPEWVHLSLFLKPSGKGKMSKRETDQMKLSGKSIFVKDMKDMGYIPEGVINWIALMGWSFDGETQYFTLKDLVEKFSIDKLNPSNAAIDFKKFDHFNGLHIRNLSLTELSKRLVPHFETAGYSVNENELLPIAQIIQERMTTLDEAPKIAGFLFEEEVKPLREDLIPKKMSASNSLEAALFSYDVISKIDEFTHETTEQPLRDIAEKMELKAGQVFGIIRVAVTGQRISPPLIESMAIIGKDKVLSRLEYAITLLKELSESEI